MSGYVAMSYVCGNTCNDVNVTSSVKQALNRQFSVRDNFPRLRSTFI